jgi:hypothetical protein
LPFAVRNSINEKLSAFSGQLSAKKEMAGGYRLKEVLPYGLQPAALSLVWLTADC